MKTLLRFLLLGLLTAAIGEWQFSVFLRNDLDNFIGSLFFNTLYLAGVYILTHPLLTTLRNWPKFILAYTGFFGLTGLMVEWFLIGNSPWGNPAASETGMFAYWSCMVLVPLVFLLQSRPLQTFITCYALVYIALILLGQFTRESLWRDRCKRMNSMSRCNTGQSGSQRQCASSRGCSSGGGRRRTQHRTDAAGRRTGVGCAQAGRSAAVGNGWLWGMGKGRVQALPQPSPHREIGFYGAANEASTRGLK